MPLTDLFGGDFGCRLCSRLEAVDVVPPMRGPEFLEVCDRIPAQHAQPSLPHAEELAIVLLSAVQLQHSRPSSPAAVVVSFSPRSPFEQRSQREQLDRSE